LATPSRAASEACAENSLRKFSESHIDEDVRNLSGTFENALFYNCTFEKLNALTLKDCVLDQSRFTAKHPREMLGFTLTLNCHSFHDVELSEEVLDTLLLLICKSKGNLEKRLKIINDVVGRDRAIQILTLLKDLE
jgi:Zn-finger protein